jgi:ketosteroid isomerase-like protein
VLVTQSAKVVKTGQQEIEEQYQNTFKAGIAHDSATVEQISPVGNELISAGEYHLVDQSESSPTKIDGHWTAVYVRDGGAWKIRLLRAFPDLPAAPPAR